MLNVSGQITRFADACHLLTDDHWVLDIITNDYALEFIEPPIRQLIPPDCVMSKEMDMVCEKEVKSLLSKGAEVVAKTANQPEGGFISNIFTILKKLGGIRPFLNLKHLNKFIMYKHFKMEGLACVKHIIQPGDQMVKLDLQDAYFLFAVTPEPRKFLRFSGKTSCMNIHVYPFASLQRLEYLPSF